MAAPALATTDELGAWLQTTIAEDDTRAPAALEVASTLVRTRAGATFLNDDGTTLADDVPDAIRQVTYIVAARLYLNPHGDVDTRTGPFSTTFGPGLELTAAESDMVDAAVGRTRGLGVISTTRGPVETRGVLPVPGGYVDVDGGEPIPLDYPGT